MKARASSFIICQIGLSIFTKEKDQNIYSIETYVFYVRPTFCGSCDKRFVCQASSINFLCAHGFDFNKFFKDGIPYINEAEEQEFCKELEDGSATRPHEKAMDIRQKRKQDMLINELLNSESRHSTENCEYQKNKRKLILPKDKISHEYFQVNELRCKYPSLWAYCENDSVIVEKVGLEEKKKLEQTVVKEKIKLLEYFLGFTRIFRLMKESKKPIVGHNLFMDLLLIFDHFHRPLPKTYKEFKKELHDVFSVVYDTRHIWRHVKKFYNFKEIPTQCGLFDLYEMFKSPSDVLTTLYSPTVRHCNGEKYLTEEFPHESGYDSFVTGWVFLKICHLLAMKKIQSSIFIKPQTLKQHLSAVEPFVNKLNLGRSRVDYIV
ncbi:poly(A)-specific ribonuclease PNLDC1-like isoform X2 [Stegodyphus dumicola]|uniref:poly(A)-specific ribonuclease PNLDC1-like isoform X2 n=1 Tax=Stegodyphus dumicola TaxID=202533 RepID=UPI0015B2D88A|nr:poly(A)-specific ribonuclease PNLDC1-like isoform X2 [Stegodyphus dumicola]